jgi:hypothetical protein
MTGPLRWPCAVLAAITMAEEFGQIRCHLVELLARGRDQLGRHRIRRAEGRRRLRIVLNYQLQPSGYFGAASVRAATVDAGQEAPELYLPVRDWSLIFTALPVKREHRGEVSRLLGVSPGTAGPINDKEMVRKTLDRKGSHYGQADKPFVVALLCMSSFMEDDDIEQALTLAVWVDRNEMSNSVIVTRRIKNESWFSRVESKVLSRGLNSQR